ncbi:MAG: YoaP domain-containing protein [Fibrobacter sp.]|jgi:hypothetical protein|nr:YoaP domain-containing protein [Fibrobacter sp.]
MEAKFIALTKENIDKKHICCAFSDKGTIFSLFHNGKFVTTDISSSMDNRFDKIVKTK